MRVLSVVALLVVALVACRGEAEPDASPAAGEHSEGLVVLTPVDPITDLAQQVLGERGTARSLVNDGDSHTFEPSPRDAVLMGKADLFLANGLGLNEAAVGLAEANLGEDVPIVELAELTLDAEDIVYERQGDAGDGGGGGEEPNPHVWMSVAYAIDYVGHIAEALATVDPSGAEDYRANAGAYIAQLAELDAAISEATATIPEEQRTLVSYHDSWAYYAPRYGLELVAAVQPSDFAQPSAAEVRTVIDQINAEGVPAVFGAREFPSDVLGTIAAETGATYVGDLSDDAFPGEPGDPQHSYIGMMLANARAITAGLGGDTGPLERIDPAGG